MFDPETIDPADSDGAAEVVAEDLQVDGDEQGVIDSLPAGGEQGEGVTDPAGFTAPEPYELNVPSLGIKRQITPDQRKALADAGLEDILEIPGRLDAHNRTIQSDYDRQRSLLDRYEKAGGAQQNRREADAEPARKTPADTMRESIGAIGKLFDAADSEAVANGSLAAIGKQIQGVLESVISQNTALEQQVKSLSGGLEQTYSSVEPSLIGREVAALNESEGLAITDADVMPHYNQAVEFYKEQGYTAAQIRAARPSIVQFAYDAAIRSSFKTLSAQATNPPSAIQGRTANQQGAKPNGSSRPATGPTQSRQVAARPSPSLSVDDPATGDANDRILGRRNGLATR